MLIDYYDRLNPPTDQDYSAFTQLVNTPRLTNPQDRFSGDRLIVQMPSLMLAQAPVYSAVGAPIPSYTRDVTIDFSAASLRSERAISIPDFGTHLSFFDGIPQITQESLWHSEVFWSRYVRQDARTGWKYYISDLDPGLYEAPVALISGPFSHHYFHFIIDTLPRIWMLGTFATGGPKRKLVIADAKPGTFQARLLQTYGYGQDDIVYLSGRPYAFDDAYYFSFNSRESLGLMPGEAAEEGGANHYKGWSPAFLDDLYERGLTVAEVPGDGRSYQKIYVSRRDVSARVCENEPDVIALLERRGFLVVCPGEMTLEQQIGVFSRARVVVGLHGAGLTNLVWARPDTRVIEIMPDVYNDMGYRFIAGIRGMPFSVVLAQSTGKVDPTDHNSKKAANCRVDLDLLARALAEQT